MKSGRGECRNEGVPRADKGGRGEPVLGGASRIRDYSMVSSGLLVAPSSTQMPL